MSAPHAPRPSHRSRRRALAGLATVAAVIGASLAGAPAASADGPTTFSNTATIAVPASGSPNQIGPASPYPSPISVTGMTGLVSEVTVTLTGVTHGAFGDVDAMLVAPTGANLVFLSDIGNPTQLTTTSNVNLTFDDDAPGAVPSQLTISSGTYKPTNTAPSGATDTFPASAPTPSAQTTFAGAFSGISPNGTWNLYIVDDASGDVGSIAGGWSLTVTTSAAAVATTTTVTTSGTPSTTGANVTFTATVTSGGSPVTTGTVQFADGATNLGSGVPLNGSGQATLTTAALIEGTHSIKATYSGASGFLTSNASVTQQVDNPTVVNGSTFCNTGIITPPASGPAQPYPSHITVSGLTGPISAVTATLKGVSHSAPIDYDILLAGPTPSTNVVLMSDTGGQNPVSNVTVTFDDSAATGVPSPLTTGTYKVTNATSETADTYPAPAPVASSATGLSTFNGSAPNGTWSLYVVDDATGDSGSISGGWCLTIATDAPTATDLTSSLNPSAVGDAVTFTATVTSDSSPVPTGSIQFRDGSTPLGGPVSVNSSGQATLTTSALAAATHTIHADYNGSPGFATSTKSLSQVVSLNATATALTSSLNPSTVGVAVTLTATVTSDGSPVATGSVQFRDDTTALGGPVSVNSSGQATLTTSALTVGDHPIHADYSGTAVYATSTSNLNQVVNDNAASLAVSKVWVVDGTTFTHGTQPSALDASLSIGGTSQAWSTPRTGLVSDNTIAVTESTSVAASSLCTVTSSRITRINGGAVNLAMPYDVPLAAGANTVEITNTVSCPARLTLTATVVNGPAPASGWTLTAVAPGGALTGPSGSTGTTGAVSPLVTYPLAAAGGDARYVQQQGGGAVAIPNSTISWTCRQVNPTTNVTIPGFSDGLNGGVTIPRGFAVVCDASFATAQLTLAKSVTNDNGGTALPTAWTLTADGPTVISGASGAPAVSASYVKPGTYTLSESGGPSGYTAGTWSCTAGTLTGSSLVLSAGQSATCTITNNDQPAHLTLVKAVTNDNGGTALPTAWTLSASGPTPISGKTGDAAITNAVVNAGTYALAESGGPSGYIASSWSCTAGTVTGSSLALGVGQSATCTITNNDQGAAPSQPPAAAPTGHLTLVKAVVNDNGGTATPTAWTLSASGPTNIAGVTGAAAITNALVTAGTYTLSETGGPAGYNAGVWRCNGVAAPTATITVGASQSVTCTVTNDDTGATTPPVTTSPLPPTATLTLVKKVVNDNGGTASATDWRLRARGPQRIAGVSGSPSVTKVTVAPGRYVLSQSRGPAGYRTSAWTCTTGKVKRQAITIAAGSTVVCTTTSNDRRRR